MNISPLITARRVVALTGAGISKESGIPTFRDSDGLWKKYRPEELASPEAFRKNPQMVWEWYAWRIRLVRNARPSRGHVILAEMERHYPEFHVITQNVDGLHQRAGSRNVVELHGRIDRGRCTGCGRVYEPAPIEDIPPVCSECNALLRPDVVWFGEPLPPDAWERAVELASQADAMLVIGTSALVYPAAHLPVLAKSQGAFLVEINPSFTPISSLADITLRTGAGEGLDLIWKEVKEHVEG